MKIEMEFQGLKELMKAFEDAASDEDIKEVNQKIVKQSEPVVKTSCPVRFRNLRTLNCPVEDLVQSHP